MMGGTSCAAVGNVTTLFPLYFASFAAITSPKMCIFWHNYRLYRISMTLSRRKGRKGTADPWSGVWAVIGASSIGSTPQSLSESGKGGADDLPPHPTRTCRCHVPVWRQVTTWFSKGVPAWFWIFAVGFYKCLAVFFKCGPNFANCQV